MAIKFFITKDFIKDCMNPNKTIRVFGAKFNTPIKGSIVERKSDETTENYTLTEIDKPYNPITRNLYDYSKIWFDVDVTDSKGANNFNSLISGDILPSDINEDRTKIKVKIPWRANLLSQQIGYLTYYTEPDSDEDELVHYNENEGYNTDLPKEFHGLTERVGLVFESAINNIGIQRSTENPKDSNSYITIDLSKLNLAANILPLRHRITTDSSETGVFKWGTFDEEHLHNLVNTTDKNGLDKESSGESTSADDIANSLIDVKSLKDNTMNQAISGSNIYLPEIFDKMGNINNSLIFTNDGRYINNKEAINDKSSKVPITFEIKEGELYLDLASINSEEPDNGILIVQYLENPNPEYDESGNEVTPDNSDYYKSLTVVSDTSKTDFRTYGIDLYDIVYI